MASITRFIQTHARQSIIGLSVLLALGLGGVAFAVSSSSGSAQVAAAPTTTTVPAPTRPPPARPKPVRGSITAMAPGSWTVRTAKGQIVTVTVTDQTKFGSVKAPLAVTAFAVGDRIVVSGPQTSTSVVARRIAKAPVKPAGSGSTTSTSTSVPAPVSAG
jgi:hypothetical protein